MEPQGSRGSTATWITAIGGLLGGLAAVAAVIVGIGNGNTDKKPTDGPQFDPVRAEERAKREASATARSGGINFSADEFVGGCEPSGNGGESQVWRCDLESVGGQCSGTVVIALNASGLASPRENAVGCGE
jgi:hypothetical protein